MLRPCHPISPEATLQPLRTARVTCWAPLGGSKSKNVGARATSTLGGRPSMERRASSRRCCEIYRLNMLKLVKPDNDGEMLCHHGVPHVALPRFFPLILENYVGNSPVPRVFPATACCLNVGLARLNLCHVLQHRPPFCQWNNQFLLSGWSCSSCLKILKWKRSYSVSLWCLCTCEHLDLDATFEQVTPFKVTQAGLMPFFLEVITCQNGHTEITEWGLERASL